MRPMSADENSATRTSSFFSTRITKTCSSPCRPSVPAPAGPHGWTLPAKRVYAPSKPTTEAHRILCRHARWSFCLNGGETAKRKSRVKRRCNMPFGAECREDGSVRFRLWAPAARQVELCLAGTFAQIPLERRDEGWFELITDVARPGTQYHFRINGEQRVPDPASRFQPRDVYGPSEVVQPDAFDWRDHAWRGRRWEEAVIYELHVGAFSSAGRFFAVRERLDYLADLGITAVELMPIA